MGLPAELRRPPVGRALEHAGVFPVAGGACGVVSDGEVGEPPAGALRPSAANTPQGSGFRARRGADLARQAAFAR
jgi:hypothetical protein